MLLRHRWHDSKVMLSLGCWCLVAGIVGLRFIHLPGDFWQGFVDGVSGMFIGMSIVFNLRGLVLRRSGRGGRR